LEENCEAAEVTVEATDETTDKATIIAKVEEIITQSHNILELESEPLGMEGIQLPITYIQE